MKYNVNFKSKQASDLLEKKGRSGSQEENTNLEIKLQNKEKYKIHQYRSNNCTQYKIFTNKCSKYVYNAPEEYIYMIKVFFQK